LLGLGSRYGGNKQQQQQQQQQQQPHGLQRRNVVLNMVLVETPSARAVHAGCNRFRMKLGPALRCSASARYARVPLCLSQISGLAFFFIVASVQVLLKY
jgi:transcription initiation factor TFIID subunit TAF12